MELKASGSYKEWTHGPLKRSVSKGTGVNPETGKVDGTTDADSVSVNMNGGTMDTSAFLHMVDDFVRVPVEWVD